MAVIEKTQPDSPVKAGSLFLVLPLAHAFMLAGRSVPLSIWMPAVLFWQDVCVALIFAIVECLAFRRAAWIWIPYWILTFYVAVNVPISRALSSPLTWPMIRAAGGPLWDSIVSYLTLSNLSMIAVVLLSAVVFPQVFSRSRIRPARILALPALFVVICGVFAAPALETFGLQRNAIGALWPSARISNAVAASNLHDWGRSPYGSSPDEDLSSFAGAAAGRNVVVIFLESTGSQYLRPFGAARDPTPNLSELARQSILFENAYAVYPESIKGFLSTMCSTYPAFHQAAEQYSRMPCSALSQRFAERGYRAALFHSGRFVYLGMDVAISGRGFDVMEDAGAIGGNVQSSFGVDEESTVHRILSWLDSLPRDDKFFLTYLPVAGHHPYATTEPGPFSEGDETSRYLNALHSGDAALGELFRGLRSRHLYDKTVFIIFGDHSEAFGQHEGNYGHTLFIYDENVHVPYWVSIPGVTRDQTRVRRVVSLLDTAPTLLDLAGLPAPASWQGKSMLQPASRMALFFTDYSLGWSGLRDVCWKYIHEIDSGWSGLYDVCADPGETHDLSASNPERTERYRYVVEHWIR